MKKLRLAAVVVAVEALTFTHIHAQSVPATEAPAQTQAQPAAQPRAAGAFVNIGFSGLADFGWSSTKDVAALLPGDHDPRVRGFTIPNAELTLDGAVDPYFRGFTSLVFKLDDEGETGVELEEMYFLTSSLPANLQLKGGQFFAEFGRQNTQHPHAWAFVDQPLVFGRLLGPEGLRGQGARLSWLLPTSFYAEAMLGVLNSVGGTTYSFRGEESADIHGGVPIEREVSGASDMLIVPRISTSFELSSEHTAVIGASAAFGPNNSGEDASTQMYAADIYWKWKSASAYQGFPFVSLQAEAMYRRYEAAERFSSEDGIAILEAETLGDRGYYAQLLWGIKPRVVAGLRAESVGGNASRFESELSDFDTGLRADRSRISPNMTWYPSEFSKFRVQYNYDYRRGIGRDHSVWLQFEFLLGAHAAHRF